MSDIISSIFWPSDLLDPIPNTELLVVGYELNDKMIVIDIVKFVILNKLNFIVSEGDIELTIVGTLNFKYKTYREFQFSNEAKRPVLELNENLIIFKPPKSTKLEYYSIDPIIIDIFWNNIVDLNDLSVEKKKYSTKLSHHVSNAGKVKDINDALKFINLTNYSRFKLTNYSSNTQYFYSKSLIKLGSYISSITVYWYAIIVQKFCLLMNHILNCSMIYQKKKITLTTSSFILHQLNFRFQQFYNLPTQFQKLKNSRIESEILIIKGTKFSPSEYIKFYNTLWLILNDLLLGMIMSNTLNRYHNSLVLAIDSSILTFQDFLFNSIRWLMNSPAGFKLNNELAGFFGELFMWVMAFWNQCVLSNLVLNTSFILTCISTLCKFGGLTSFLAALVDLTNLVTFHLYCFYFASTRVFNWQSHILRSLFRLFYGKKYNILRNRIDSNNYEFDQLLFGIIIFTMLIYLLPTVLAFYLNFVAARLLSLLICSILEIGLVSLNHLPIVVMLLKVKNKERLPGGIILLPEFDDNGCCHFRLLTKSLSTGEILKSHMKSLLNFNLINSRRFYDVPNITPKVKVEMDDVLENWRQLSLVHIFRRILLGDFINSFEYKKMF